MSSARAVPGLRLGNGKISDIVIRVEAAIILTNGQFLADRAVLDKARSDSSQILRPIHSQ